MIRRVLLAAGVTMFCADAAFACSMPWMPWSRVVRSTMTVQSGKPCEIWFRSAGPVYDIRVTKKPAHGTVSIGSANKVIYQSRPGYTGPDSFTYMYSGRSANNVPARSDVIFAVTVTP